MNTLTATSSSTPSSHHGLCPNCGGVQLSILTSAVVTYDVRLEPETFELLVVGERLGESDWDYNSRVACPACQWQGTLQNAMR
ncbi:hypothetical protein BH24DEI2_BH24DEI2_11450 [soil metagenome]